MTRLSKKQSIKLHKWRTMKGHRSPDLPTFLSADTIFAPVLSYWSTTQITTLLLKREAVTTQACAMSKAVRQVGIPP